MNFYRSYQNRYVIPRFGSMKLSAIKRPDVKRFRAELIAQGLATNTIRLAIASLRTVLTSAVEDEILAVNPAASLGKFKSTKPKREPQAMEPEEVGRFLSAAREYSEEYFPLFSIAILAGLRQGELLALKWGDLQFGSGQQCRGYIRVQRRWYRDSFDIPKGNRPRDVNMPPGLRLLLLELRDRTLLRAYQQGKNSISDDLLFPGQHSDNPVSVRTLVENYFEPILASAGLRRFTWHDMRHTFGSLLIEAGAPVGYVAEQMGHTTTTVTQMYIHLLERQRKIGFTDRLETLYLPQPSATQAQLKPEDQPAEIVSDWGERCDVGPQEKARQMEKLPGKRRTEGACVRRGTSYRVARCVG